MDLEEKSSFESLRRLVAQNSGISDVVCSIGRGTGAIGDFEQLNMGAIEASMNVNLLAPLRFFEGDPTAFTP